jgi:hypothetical protein
MNKKSIRLFTLSLLFSYPTFSSAIALKAPILSTIDGLSFGIDGDTMAMMKQYQSQIRAILHGKLQANGTRQGWYQFEGSSYSVVQLHPLEEQYPHNPRFRKLLKQMRSDFEAISEPFKKIVGNVKSVMAILIDESCEVRKRRDNCLLSIWAHTDQMNEYELFDTHVKTTHDFAIFLTDLYNFLGDLVDSCPKARRQFAERVEKYKRVKELLPRTSIPLAEHGKALNKINNQLGKIQKNEITPAKIEELARQ